MSISSSQSLNVAVVGFGMSATVFHLPFLHTLPGFRIAAIVQRKGDDAKAAYPEAEIYRDAETMLQNDQIDLVVITTPNTTHFPLAKAALLAGKHVVLEKPFAITTEEAAELVQLVTKTGKILSVYHNRRYVSDFLTVQQIIAQNLIGPVHEYECHYDRYRPNKRTYGFWREADEPGSGILYDLGSHLIDQALRLFGLPQKITADLKMQLPHSVTVDYFDLRLDFGFTKAILKSSMLVREMGPRYMVHGTIGSFIKSGDDPQEEILKTGVLPIGEDWGREPEEMVGLLHTAVNGDIIRRTYPSLKGNFGAYYSNLYETIVHGAPLSEKPEHGYNVVRMIELAMQSHAEQRTIACTGLMDIAY